MCLAIPGKILDTTERNHVRHGRVNFGGVVREVCLDFVPDAAVGDYVIVHVGFAISRVDADEARKTYDALQQMGLLEAELRSDLDPIEATGECEPGDTAPGGPAGSRGQAE